MPDQVTIGRPRKYRTAVQMERSIKDYLAENDAKLTITGLANHLGLTRKQLIEYEERSEYANLIKGARSIIEQRIEELLLYSKHGQAGLIFWLKNAGWTDKQEIDVNDITTLTKDDLVKKLERMQARPVAMRKKPDDTGKTGTDY